MKMEDNQVAFTKVPTMVVVRPSLSKAKHKYFTFLTSEGCEYLQAYLEKRIAEGEELSPESNPLKKGIGASRLYAEAEEKAGKIQ